MTKVILEQTVGASELSENLIQNNVVVNAHLYGVVCGSLYSLILLRLK